MNILHAILLGVLQGITEFLPVSSSGHLVITQALLPGFKPPGVMFDLWLHLGTLGAVFIYFRHDIVDLLRSLWPKKKTADSHLVATQRKLSGLILLGCLPTALIGLVFKHQLEALFESASSAAAMLLVTGVLLWLADRVTHTQRGPEQMKPWDALLIGTVQGIAIIPGISRSGSTICAGIFCRLNRELAARYSFLLSIPAIMGATLLEAKEWRQLWHTIDVLPLTLGVLCALITGYLAIGWLMRLLVKQKLSYFAYYCWAVGLISLIALGG
jgi:undecaprenyl-diphosphatase